MTEPTRRRSWVVDIWDRETDPGLRHMADALALEPVREDVPEPPKGAAPEPPPLEAHPTESPRQSRTAELVARIRAGDLSAIDVLRRLLDKA